MSQTLPSLKGLLYRLGVQHTRIWRHFHDTVRVQSVIVPTNDLPTRMLYRLRRQIYEHQEAEAVQRMIDAHTPVIELGGCLGVISTLTSRLLADETPHIVVEANPDVLTILEKTRKLNDADFDIVHGAYSTAAGDVRFDAQNTFATSKISSTGETSVPSITLKELHDQIDNRSFNLIVDIEGGEYDLTDELPLLQQHCKTAIIELHGSKKQNNDFIKQFTNAGFTAEETEGLLILQNQKI